MLAALRRSLLKYARLFHPTRKGKVDRKSNIARDDTRHGGPEIDGLSVRFRQRRGGGTDGGGVGGQAPRDYYCDDDDDSYNNE